MTKIINGVASEFEFPADTGVFTQNVFEKENEILRKNAEHNDKVVDKVNWENMLLKKENKQLEENKNPLKGIFAQVNDDMLLRDCGNMNAEINELKTQQKEFMK